MLCQTQLISLSYWEQWRGHLIFYTTKSSLINLHSNILQEKSLLYVPYSKKQLRLVISN